MGGRLGHQAPARNFRGTQRPEGKQRVAGGGGAT